MFLVHLFCYCSLKGRRCIRGTSAAHFLAFLRQTFCEASVLKLMHFEFDFSVNIVA